jgi:hypothetical protein
MKVLKKDGSDGLHFYPSASAVMFSATLTAVEQDPFSDNSKKKLLPPAQLSFPNGSCTLSSLGGSSTSQIQSPVPLQLHGNTFATLSGGLIETYDQRSSDKEAIVSFSRVELQGLSVGFQDRFSFNHGGASMRAETTAAGRSFKLSTPSLNGVNLGARRYDVRFASFEKEATYQELLLRLAAEPWRLVNPVIEYSDREPLKVDAAIKKNLETLKASDLVMFHTLAEPPQPADGSPPDGMAIGTHGLRLPSLGAVFFGEMIADPKSRRFLLTRFRFGSYAQGDGVSGEIRNNGVG